MRYFANLSIGRIVLWCYFIWYCFFCARYFDPSAQLWGTAAGIAGIVGIALLLGTWSSDTRLASWTTAHLFLMPFCVSSFSALVKGLDFYVVFSPRPWENFAALGCCAFFVCFTLAAKLTQPKESAAAAQTADEGVPRMPEPK